MENQFQIKAECIDTKRFAIIFMSLILGGTYLSFGIAFKTHYTSIAIVGLILFAVLPLLLMKTICLLFTKKIKVVFFDKYFSILKINLHSDLEVNKEEFYYDDILSCSINSTQSQYSTIVLNIINKKKTKITFKKTDFDEQNSVSEIIFQNIRKRKQDVLLTPTFFSSNRGTSYIVGLGVLIIILLFLHIFYSPQTSPITFIIGISLFINIFVKRKKDMETLKRLNDQ